MTRWVCIVNRIISCIRIAIQALHTAGDNRVRLGEASQGGVVPAGVVEHQAEICGVGVLSRVGVVGGTRIGSEANFTLFTNRYTLNHIPFEGWLCFRVTQGDAHDHIHALNDLSEDRIASIQPFCR